MCAGPLFRFASDTSREVYVEISDAVRPIRGRHAYSRSYVTLKSFFNLHQMVTRQSGMSCSSKLDFHQSMPRMEEPSLIFNGADPGLRSLVQALLGVQAGGSTSH